MSSVRSDGPGAQEDGSASGRSASNRRALSTVASEDDEYAQLSAKRLAHYVFEVFTAGLLLKEAQRGLEDGDVRMALVARRFAERKLERSTARGIVDGE